MTTPEWATNTANWIRENSIVVCVVLGSVVLLGYFFVLFSGMDSKHEDMYRAQLESKAALSASYKDIRVIRTYDRGMGYGIVTFKVRGVVCQLPYRPLDGGYVIDVTEAPPVCSPVPLT